MLITRSNIQ